MKRKTITVYALLFMLIASMVGTGFVSLVEANFTSTAMFNFDILPITDTPSISILSPSNQTIQQNSTNITFNVAMPQSWNCHFLSYQFFVGQVKSVTCSLDQTQILSNETLYGLTGFFVQNYSDPNYQVRSINYSQEVGLLSLGQHSLIVSVKAKTLYNYQHDSWYDVSASATFMFSVGAKPILTNLSIENRTYDKPLVPLVFNVNDSTSWMGFSLDNQANVTLYENVTLTDLAEGNHSLVVYANDTFGNMGKSDTVLFSIVLPTPSPSPTPTLSPTLLDSPDTVPPVQNWVTDWGLSWSVIIIVFAGVVGALIYLRKRRKKGL